MAAMSPASRDVFARALGLEPTGAVAAAAAAEVTRLGLGPLAAHYELGADRAAARILAASALRSRVLHARSIATARAVVEALKGVRFVVVKGPSVGVRFYPRPELRESVDLDILAAKKDHREIEAKLARLGYEGDRSEAVGAEVTFIPPRAALMSIDFHFELWTGKPSLAEVLKRAEVIDAGGVRIPVPAERMEVELLATHYLRDLGDKAGRLLDVLLARKKTGVEIAHEATRRIVMRDAKTWFGIGEGAAAPRGAWGWIDEYMQRTDPLTRLEENVAPKSRMLRLLVSWLQKPSRAIARTLLALNPATATSGRWSEEKPGWKLRRLAAFVKSVVKGS
jgi:hypothetical protein